MVLDQQDGHVALVPDGPGEPGEQPDLLVVQPCGRLVEQEEPGLPGQCPGELDALQRPAAVEVPPADGFGFFAYSSYQARYRSSRSRT